ncbi:hypothetical protein LMP74_05265 [Staphylococcus aureus]|nr:hypothetical protein [Staphylococcus aureus]MCC5354907.1 hypothetical protein [Staphylococcus aureus]NGA99118.1 hypothetical protein [Staphylococcus aureus]NGD18279.1 hypothetical protein [Staphylococcus aureus]NGF88518.1 hypothetical protein [Staphylococcus aureus]HCC5686163.1 hypothetical protein [Staphylococcus aureus]
MLDYHLSFIDLLIPPFSSRKQYDDLLFNFLY